MIEIQQLEAKSKLEIIDFLLEQKNTIFEIYIPKETLVFSSNTRDIAIEYLELAYSGQLLNEVADEFEYEQVPPSELKSVLFSVKTQKIEELATALLKISFGYVNDCEDEIYEDSEEAIIFQEYAAQFISDVENEELVPVCQEFCDIYFEYINKE